MIGLVLWLLLVVAQHTHEWSHYCAKDTNSEHHCHVHDVQEVSKPSNKTVIHPAHLCILCDWDWIPAAYNPSDKTCSLILPWQTKLRIGEIHSGYANQCLIQTRNQRGPPSKG